MVVLATKVYVEGDARERALDSLNAQVRDAIGGLTVEWEIGVRHDDFPSVTLSGPDEIAARNQLIETFGEITADESENDGGVGTLEAWDESGFTLDAGRSIKIQAEQLDLGPGAPPQIRERFGLVQHIPLRFEDGSTPSVAEAERDRLYDWQRGPGRVNVNSATRGEVRATVNRAGHANDIVTVERLGLLEQSIICADGTDPPGLLASIGEYLPAELLCVV